MAFPPQLMHGSLSKHSIQSDPVCMTKSGGAQQVRPSSCRQPAIQPSQSVAKGYEGEWSGTTYAEVKLCMRSRQRKPTDPACSHHLSDQPQPMRMSGSADMPGGKRRALTSRLTCGACAPTCQPRRSTSSRSTTTTTGSQAAEAPTPLPCLRPSSVRQMLRWGCATLSTCCQT